MVIMKNLIEKKYLGLLLALVIYFVIFLGFESKFSEFHFANFLKSVIGIGYLSFVLLFRKKFSIIQALIVFITTFVLYYLADYIEYNIYNLSNILTIIIYACSATIICWLVNSRWSECSDTCIGQECGCHESYDLIVRIARRYYVIIQKQPKEVYILTNNRQRLSIA